MPKLGTWLASRQLLTVAAAYRPELILLFHADKISDQALLRLKREHPAAPIINIDCDLIEIPRNRERILRRGAQVDATLITSAGVSLKTLRDSGLRAGYIPNPADPSLDDMGDAPEEREWDMVYFAAADPDSSKWAVAKAVAEAAPDLKIGLMGSRKQRIFGRTYYDILTNSRTALNWSSDNTVDLYSSDRIGQLFGSGICTCLQRSSGFQRFIPEDAAIFFDDPAELAASLREIVHSGEWKTRGEAGQQLYLQLFNERRVAQYVIDFALERALDQYEWGDL